VTAITEASLNLYLFRHGQTEWSLSGRHTGSTDIPLTKQGEDEARALLPWVNQTKFDHVLTSPRQRAKETCKLVGLGRDAEIEPDLAEWNYGAYEGKLSSEIRKDQPHWNIFRDGCPQGEMPEQVSERADRLIARLSMMTGNVALFSHGHFLPALTVRWLGLAISEGEHLQLGTASLSILGYNPSHPDTRVISLWNSMPRRFSV
jgi:broad specificity phosphatase PhoE